MSPKQVVRHFGGVNATASRLGIKPPSVSDWLKWGKVPRLRQFEIEHLTKGKLKVGVR